MTTYGSLRQDYAFKAADGNDAAIAMSEFERREKARSIVVPTDDGRIKVRLIELGEPIILFGEGIADRRDRLRYLLSLDNGDTKMDESEPSGDEEEEYYTTGTQSLLLARRCIAQYSLPRAAARHQLQKEQATVPLSQQLVYRKNLVSRLRNYVSQGSQIAGDRPVSIARFSPNSELIATGSWAGDVSIFDATTLERQRKVTGHQEKVGGVSWHPQATLSLDEAACNLISGGGESDICMWSMQSDTPLATLKGHGARVVRTEFHPSGDYFASASFDGTWRLWDVNTTEEVLLQQGHSHEVYTVAFHSDGSLLASGGLDAMGRVWDLRTGKTIMVLDGHVKAIQGLSFSENGYHLASGSADDTIRIWDLRQVKCSQVVAAHKSLVSDIRFSKMRQGGILDRDSSYLVSSGYDGSVNIWSASDWTLVKSLQGMDEKKVMSVDVAPNGQSICASSWDRTLRLWTE